MAEQQNEEPKILQELAKLREQLSRGSEYQLENGKWDDNQIIDLLSMREIALAKTYEAVKAGHNNHITVASMLAMFGINPDRGARSF